MISHQSSESIKIFDSLIDPENAEELKRAKTDIETNITNIQKLIKRENERKNDGNPRRSRKAAELMGLTEDLYKQYRSLYEQYDNVIGKVVSEKRNKKASGSSSDSDSEYFSTDEVYGSNRRRSAKEQSNISDTVDNTNEVLKIETSVEEKESERKLMEEMDSLSSDKTNLELEIESQENDVKQLSIKNTELNNHVMELESLLKEKQGVVSNLEVKLNNSEEQAKPNIVIDEVEELSIKNTELNNHVIVLESLLKDKQDVVSDLEAKLNNSEEQAKSNIIKLMAQVNELVHETESLRTEKDEMEGKIECDKNEASTERDDLMEKLHVMRQKLDSLGNQNKDLEAQLEIKEEEVSEFLIQIENLKGNIAEMKSTEQTMIKKKEGFLTRLKNMEFELETQSNQKDEVEEQLRDASYEIKQLMNENQALQDRNHELKAAMTQRGEEISVFLRENDSDENGVSMEILSLRAEVNEMRLELDNLREQKTKLELQNERNQKEYEESLAKMETLNIKLETQIADQEKTIKDQTSTIARINTEQKQTMITSNKLRLNQRSAERKMEELADVLRKKMEDSIRLLHQRIHVAEQLNNENRNSCNLVKIRYEEENKILGEKVLMYEDELKRLKECASEVTQSQVVDLKAFEFEAALNDLDLVATKFEEHKECVMSNVSKMLCEVQLAKDSIKKKNTEMKQMRDNVEHLNILLSEKEEQELLLRDKVWNLEAKVSKEGGEKMNLKNEVSQLEKKVGKLEKNMKEKDEDLEILGEKKREAIRQLCLVVEFHRDRCNYLMNLVPNTMRVNYNKT